MSSSTASDELVSQFLAVTGSADTASAISYLEMSGNNLDTAVALFMEHGSNGVGSSPAGMGGFSGGGMGGGFLGDTSGAAGAAGMVDGDIRAPDATQRMRLMDDGMIASDPRIQLMNAMMEDELASSAFASGSRHRRRDHRAAINQAAARAEDEDDYEEVKAMDDGDEDEETKITEPKRLSDLFEAPKHLMHTAGGFQGARTMAKDSKHWLLVNIQNNDHFACHALNRDVWSDEFVENVIRAGFIFWQQMAITPEGRTYVERYNVQDYPHVGIIDPRTGRLLWRKEGWTQEDPMTASSFAEIAMDFCSRNSFDRPPQAPRPASLATGATSLSTGLAPQRPGKRPMHQMSEDEQMKAAIQASIVEKNDDDDDDNDDDEIEYIESDDEVEVVEASEMDTKPQAIVEENAPTLMDTLLGMTIPPEPASGAKIQLRMPDGKRVVRKFSGSDMVKIIYAFVVQSNEANGDGELQLMAGFPPRDLIESLDKTIDECSLKGESVTARWKS